MDDVADPLEYLEAEELVKDMAALSDTLHRTISQVVLYGVDIQTVADIEGVDVNTIYQRIHQAKKELNNGR